MSFSPHDQAAINQVVDRLRHSRSLLFITGAGISADSGLPTYRGIGGLYNSDTTEDGYPIEELLSGSMLRRRPELTWKYIAHIAQATGNAKFNRGHAVIAQMESHFERVWTLTQNIDGFHRQAGSKNVIEIHGDLHDLRCTECTFRQTIRSIDEITVPPRCPKCGAIVRPDVVLFGEFLSERKLGQLYQELQTGFDIVFTIGTTSVFPYITEPVLAARQKGWTTVEINPGHTTVSDLVDIKLSLGAAQALDAIWTQYQTPAP
jgi:NAD-dependent deacetylase